MLFRSSTYITNRNSLILLVIVVDARHGLKPLDWQMLDWLAPTGKAVHILLTKSDKLTRSEGAKALSIARLQAGGGDVALFSALKKQGLEQTALMLWNWTHPEP